MDNNNKKNSVINSNNMKPYSPTYSMIKNMLMELKSICVELHEMNTHLSRLDYDVNMIKHEVVDEKT